MLIEARCNVDLHDKEGFTPLYIAAQEGYAVATKQLIEARCNVDPQLPCGATPLFIADQRGHAGVTKQLIEAHCNMDLQMEDESTPLFITAEKTWENMISLDRKCLNIHSHLDLKSLSFSTESTNVLLPTP
jgi:cytohesin